MNIFKSIRNKDFKKLALLAAVLLTTSSLMMFVPEIAMAIPGAGDLTSLDSAQGRKMSYLYDMITIICLVIFLIVSVVMVLAIAKFRRKSEDEMPEQTHGNLKIEVGILVAATLVQIFIGWKTIEVMWFVEKMPEQIDMTVEAHAYKWGWRFYYPATEENKEYIKEAFTSDDLVIPAHVNVKILVTSDDVIHSIFVPELGIKMDAVPGRFNYWWVNADGPLNQTVVGNKGVRLNPKNKPLKSTRPKELDSFFQALNMIPANKRKYDKVNGLEQRVTYLAQSREVEKVSPYAKYNAIEYRGMCTELCGTGHYNMYFRTVAMTSSSFKQWVADTVSGANKGEADGGAIYASKCASCHGPNGEGKIGAFPPLANSDYISQDTDENKRRHIEVVLKGLKGEITVNGTKYNGQMQGWAQTFNDDEVAAVVNHERTSWGNKYGSVDSALVAQVREALGFPAFAAGGIAPVPEADLMFAGKKFYAACSTCHGENGKATYPGMPNIAGNPAVLSTPDKLVDIMVNGIPGKKTAMGRNMSNQELASIITYIRKSFGNKAKVVQPGEVARIRKDVTKPLKK